ncbi:hypothetical protein B7P02_01920 [Bordetella bronchiseptica]|nr:hypothetical protein BTL45_01920 [Bordetella bronchiseptica]AWP56817.1 hypothetical protein B7P02_01920 [Bordetella bronchiseptica]
MDEYFFDLSKTDQRDVLEYGRAETGRPAHLFEKDIWVPRADAGGTRAPRSITACQIVKLRDCCSVNAGRPSRKAAVMRMMARVRNPCCTGSARLKPLAHPPAQS